MSAALALGQRAWSTARIVWAAPFAVRFRGVLQALLATLLLVAMISWNPADPSLNAASSLPTTNWLGGDGALFADLFMQSLGVLGAWMPRVRIKTQRRGVCTNGRTVHAFSGRAEPGLDTQL